VITALIANSGAGVQFSHYGRLFLKKRMMFFIKTQKKYNQQLKYFSRGSVVENLLETKGPNSQSVPKQSFKRKFNLDHWFKSRATENRNDLHLFEYDAHFEIIKSTIKWTLQEVEDYLEKK
jgi:phosphoadenosine phosphosulfate reductase